MIGRGGGVVLPNSDRFRQMPVPTRAWARHDKPATTGSPGPDRRTTPLQLLLRNTLRLCCHPINFVKKKHHIEYFDTCMEY